MMESFGEGQHQHVFLRQRRVAAVHHRRTSARLAGAAAPGRRARSGSLTGAGPLSTPRRRLRLTLCEALAGPQRAGQRHDQQHRQYRNSSSLHTPLLALSDPLYPSWTAAPGRRPSHCSPRRAGCTPAPGKRRSV
jgi:hypothetical protein